MYDPDFWTCDIEESFIRVVFGGRVAWRPAAYAIFDNNADADGDSTIICATYELTELHESESEAIDLEHMELFESNAVDVEIPTGCGPGTYACISCCSLTELLDTVEVVNEDLADVDPQRQ